MEPCDSAAVPGKGGHLASACILGDSEEDAHFTPHCPETRRRPGHSRRRRGPGAGRLSPARPPRPAPRAGGGAKGATPPARLRGRRCGPPGRASFRPAAILRAARAPDAMGARRFTPRARAGTDAPALVSLPLPVPGQGNACRPAPRQEAARRGRSGACPVRTAAHAGPAPPRQPAAAHGLSRPHRPAGGQGTPATRPAHRPSRPRNGHREAASDRAVRQFILTSLFII